MSPESTSAMRWQRRLFKIGLGKLYLKYVQSVFSLPIWDKVYSELLPQEAGGADLREELIKRFQDSREYEKYINDRVYRDEFWNELCIERDRVAGTQHVYPLDTDFFLAAPEREMVRIPIGLAARAVSANRTPPVGFWRLRPPASRPGRAFGVTTSLTSATASHFRSC